MVVDAVMSMVGVGLGDAVVEAVLPGGEAMNAGGHAIEAHAQEEPRSGPHCAEKSVESTALGDPAELAAERTSQANYGAGLSPVVAEEEL